jgi:large subunit ribosomal protein L20
MVRVKRGNVARTRRKKILKFAKGFKGAHSRLFRTANGQVMKALIYSYIGRKRRKQDFKKLWICRVNAAARSEGLTYSSFRSSLKKSSIGLNLKMLAQLSVLDKETFNSLVKEIFCWTKFKNVSAVICFR